MIRALSLALLTVLVTNGATAQPLTCIRHDILPEVMAGFGLAQAIAVPVMVIGMTGGLEIWVHGDRSWIMFLTGNDGQACVMMQGTDWKQGEET